MSLGAVFDSALNFTSGLMCGHDCNLSQKNPIAMQSRTSVRKVVSKPTKIGYATLDEFCMLLDSSIILIKLVVGFIKCMI